MDAQPIRPKPIRVFLCGDVMTGRGVDQILPHAGNPLLHESYVESALDYVRLAEDANGPIARPQQLVGASRADAEWLAHKLDEISRGHRTRIGLAEGGRFMMSWR